VIVQSHPSGADGWLVVAGPHGVLALPAGEAARVDALVSRLAEPDGFRAALESLVSAGIAGAPPFALLDGDAGVLRVVLRGEAAVTAQVAGSAVTFSGDGMSTWTERVLEGATGVQLTVPGSTWTVVLGAAVARVDRPTEQPSASGGATAPAAQRGADSGESAAETTLVPRAQPQPVLDEPQADPNSEAYDFLFGDTIYRTQAGASIRIPNPDPERPGDHDGQTMLATDLGRPQVSTRRADADAADDDGHAPSLPLGPTLQLERADGSREPLNRAVLIGRSPAVSGSDPQARLIAITDDPDISRTHLRVAVEGDAVVVTDLDSKNGSIITLPGAAPRKLRASEPTVVLPGTLIDLGGGTTFTVRED
jgi:hypothetical protein